MGWWYSFSSNKMNNKWGIYYTHLREFWWWYFTYVCMYNIYVKWGEAFSLTHVQHRVIITLLLKWLTFAFDCPKNMNNNIQLPWLSWWALKLFLEVCFWGEGMTGLSRPKQPMTIIKQAGERSPSCFLNSRCHTHWYAPLRHNGHPVKWLMMHLLKIYCQMYVSTRS